MDGSGYDLVLPSRTASATILSERVGGLEIRQLERMDLHELPDNCVVWTEEVQALWSEEKLHRVHPGSGQTQTKQGGTSQVSQQLQQVAAQTGRRCACARGVEEIVGTAAHIAEDAAESSTTESARGALQTKQELRPRWHNPSRSKRTKKQQKYSPSYAHSSKKPTKQPQKPQAHAAAGTVTGPAHGLRWVRRGVQANALKSIARRRVCQIRRRMKLAQEGH